MELSPQNTPNQNITKLLVDWRNGDQEALNQLMPLVYEELRRMANYYMRNERQGHTLQTSALVNEAYLRLVDHENIQWQNRSHFFGLAAQAMRRILVDHARSRNYQKRGGGAEQVSLDEAATLAEDRAAELIALDEALQELAKFDQRKSRIVEMRYFGGLSGEEVAEALGVSTATVSRDWETAKAWLLRELSRKEFMEKTK
ncbi:MAG: sigma-70 family RNA polymerase sigma factor [Acidobacteria bacterium]|nr:sigma-70 family RNA polymerase sigma factor [Acidobacteriota bacterium]